jgi:hypothetical protein
MKLQRKQVGLLFVTLLFSAGAAANDSLWFGVKAGTLGIGGEVAWRPIEWLDIRGGVNFYDFDDTASYAGIDYDGTLSLDNYYLTGNLRFPLSPFRLTAGIYVNNNEVSLVSQDMAEFPIGNNPIPYSPADVGTLTGNASFDSPSPYVGAGFDFDILDRLGMSLDFGVLLQGEPVVSLSADGLLANDPAFLADLNDEVANVTSELSDLKAYPVVSLGVHFNFF